MERDTFHLLAGFPQTLADVFDRRTGESRVATDKCIKKPLRQRPCHDKSEGGGISGSHPPIECRYLAKNAACARVPVGNRPALCRHHGESDTPLQDQVNFVPRVTAGEYCLPGSKTHMPHLADNPRPVSLF